jgi:hypothetical protein
MLVDGVIAGTWSHAERPYGLEVAVEPFAPLDAETHAGIDAEAARLAGFLGREAHRVAVAPAADAAETTR